MEIVAEVLLEPRKILTVLCKFNNEIDFCLLKVLMLNFNEIVSVIKM